MSTRKLIIGFLIPIFFLGCATVRDDNVGVVVDAQGVPQKKRSDVIVSANLLDDMSSEYFGFVDFTLENNSDKWIRLTHQTVRFEDDFKNQNIKFVAGKDFDAWLQAALRMKEINESNSALVKASFAAAGIVLADASGDKSAKSIGNIAATAAIASIGASEYNAHLDALQNAKMFPENNLLSDTIVIPPNLHAKKWLLLNSQRHDKMEYVTDLFFEYSIEGGGRERVAIKLRDVAEGHNDVWQRKILARKDYHPRQAMAE